MFECFVAANGGFTDIVQLLLQKNADVNAKTDRGDTALMLGSLIILISIYNPIFYSKLFYFNVL